MIRDRIIDLRRVPAGTLRPHPRNWRKHPTRQRQALTTALERIGYADALIARETPDGLELIDGHLRADLDADQTVPVLVVDLDDAEADAMLATFDPLAGMAERDTKILDELLARVAETDLDALARNVWPGRMGTPAGADDVPEPPSEPICKPGDLWQLGRHRLLCGDATVEADVSRVLGGERPRLMVTDPPYGVNYTGGVATQRKREGLLGDEDASLYAGCLSHSPAIVSYLWHAGTKAGAVYDALGVAGWQVRSQIIWNKLNAHYGAAAADYKQRHEPCVYAVRGPSRFIGPTNEPTVWDIPQPSQNELHPTQKPLECMARPIRNHEGDIYEPFAGSGTTIIAAETLDRTCYAIEIEPRYCDVIIERWQNFTGQQAQRIDTG